MMQEFSLRRFAVVVAGLLGLAAFAPAAAQSVAPAPNGIEIPDGYKDWRLIAVSHRTDNNTLRAILGNDIAIEAARSGRTHPWPDGAVLAKLVWRDAVHEAWDKATVPGPFIVQEFMLKDARRFAATGGWGYARWLGAERKPYGKDATFDQECYGCHIPRAQDDYVFTDPVRLP